MNQRLYCLCAAALLLSAVAAAAQPAAPAPRAPVSPAPAIAPAAPGPEDDMAMVLGDLFGFDGPGDAPLALGEAPEAPEGPGEGPLAFDDDGPGPGGPEHMHRRMPDGPRGRAMMMRHGMAMRFAALDLTDAQRDKLRDIHEAAARKSVQRRADMELARMDLRKLMRADAPTTSSVNAQIDKITRLQADGMKAHFDTFMQARAVLTPEQLKQLKSGPAEMRARPGHGEHMEHGGHGED
jgi:Spy/CpxP family protein refolding chaperone